MTAKPVTGISSYPFCPNQPLLPAAGQRLGSRGPVTLDLARNPAKITKHSVNSLISSRS